MTIRKTGAILAVGAAMAASAVAADDKKELLIGGALSLTPMAASWDVMSTL